MSSAQDKNPSPPKLSDVFVSQKRDVMHSVNSIKVGIVQSIDTANNTVSVQLVIKRLALIREDGTRVFEEKPLLASCPIVEMYGGSGLLTMPIAVGDECLVFFSDDEIDNWWNTGAVSAPTTSRIHDISDGFALVGVRSVANLVTRLTNGARLAYASSKIDLLDGSIESESADWQHTGAFQINGITTFNGQCRGLSGGAIAIDADLVQTGGKTLSAGNGATGTFTQVTVVDGIVTGGT